LAQTWTEPAWPGFTWNRYVRNGPKTEPLLTLYFDAYFKYGVVTVLQSVSPTKAANMFVKNNNDKVTGENWYLPDNKLLTLGRCSF